MLTPNQPAESRTNRIVIGSIITLMLLLGIALGVVMQHQPGTRPAWRVAITNWPGFDPLYIAGQKGFLKEQGLDIELVPVNSLSDIRKAFERGTVDGYTGAIMEAVESVQDSNTPHRIVLVTDYSKGADQLLADPSITTLDDLRGKRLSLEITSPIARYMLARALAGSSVTQADMDLRPYNQSILIDQTLRGNLDAVITYEPYTTAIQAKRPMHVLFSSADIPEEVLDAIMVSPAMLASDPGLSRKLQAAWQAALDYIATHPEETTTLLAQRYGITGPEYQSMLTGVHIFNRTEIQRLASLHGVQQTLWRMSQVLNPAQPLTREQIAAMVQIWYQREAAR